MRRLVNPGDAVLPSLCSGLLPRSPPPPTHIQCFFFPTRNRPGARAAASDRRVSLPGHAGRPDSHVCNVDDLLVAEARGPEINPLLLSKLEVLAAALARQEGGQKVLQDPHLRVLQVETVLTQEGGGERNIASRTEDISIISSRVTHRQRIPTAKERVSPKQALVFLCSRVARVV